MVNMLLLPFMAGIGIDDLCHDGISDHIITGQFNDPDLIDIATNSHRIDQSTGDFMIQIDLTGIPGNDHP